MPNQNEPKKERTFYVHTLGGEKLPIKAHSYVVNARENRVYFLDGEEQIKTEWEVFASGVAAIHEPPPGKVTSKPLSW